MTKITYIPGEIANAAIDEHGNRKPVTRTQHIFDDNLEKPQNEVNQDRIEDVVTLDGKIALEKQRAEGVESGLNNRLGTVEQLAEISIGGGDAQIATGADFTNPDATKRAKVPTVGAIVDGLNDGIYDVSKRNPTGGPNSDGKFTLEYILSNADTLIPTGWRHGGMIISFVQSSDNKYVQYLYIGTSTSVADFTNTANWEKVNLDKEFNLFGMKIGNVLTASLSNFSNEFRYKVGITGEVGSVITENVLRGNGGSFLIPCEMGDLFEIYTRSVDTYRAFYILDADKKIVYIENYSTTPTLYTAVISRNKAKYIGVNVLFDIDDTATYYIKSLDLNKKITKISQGDSNLINSKVTYSLTSKQVGDSVTDTPAPSSSQVAIEVPCSEGDEFHLETYQGNDFTRYVFINNNRIVIAKGSGNGIVETKVVAPRNATALIVQSFNGEGVYTNAFLYKYTPNEISIMGSVINNNNHGYKIADIKFGKDLYPIYENLGDVGNIMEHLGTFTLPYKTIGDAVPEIDSSSSQVALEIPCNEGDVFIVKTYQGADFTRAAFIDEERKIIELSHGNGFVTDIMSAPNGAVKLVVQGSVIEQDQYVRKPNQNDTIIYNKLAKITYNEAITEEFVITTNGKNPYANYALDEISSAVHVDGDEYAHDAYISIPKGSGKCKLVVVVGGGDALATWVRDYYNIGKIWNALGYAVLGVMGWSRQWKSEYSLESINPSGNWMATEAVLKAYKYVIEKYDCIDKNGVFMYGESQGGCVIENVAETKLIPVLATILDSPVLSIQYHQFVNRYEDANMKAKLDSYYHFDGTFSKEKVIGCDPFTRNMSNDITMNVTGDGVTDIHIDVDTITQRKFRSCGTPIMILIGQGDAVLAEDVQLAYARALQNASLPVCCKYYSDLSGQKHGCIECSASVTIEGFQTGNVLYDVLEFMKGNGGY